MASTTGELVKAKTILIGDVVAAVQAYIADPDIGEIALGEGYVLDVGEAVRSSFYAKPIVADPDATATKRRNAVQTAILLAVPRAKP